MTQSRTNKPDVLPLRGVRILVVDDDSDTRKMLKFVLEQNGATVSATDAVQSAIQLFEQVRTGRIKALGPDDRATLDTTRYLANAYRAAGRLPEAVQLLEHIRDRYLATLGPHNSKTLMSQRDVAYMYRDAGRLPDALRLFDMCDAIDRCPAPVVARIQGYALGGGSGLAACSDIAIAARDAIFGFTEVKLGIIPAVISPFVLPKIGQHARRYFLTGERFDAQTALRIGLVHEVTDDLDSAVHTVLDQRLSAGPNAAREAKKLIRERPAGQETAEIAARMRTSEEGQKRLRAFLDRRS